MSENARNRVSGDLLVMQQRMGLRLPCGKGILAVNMLLALAAIGSAFLSLRVESDWLQQVPFAAIMVLVPAGLFVQSRRTRHEINSQLLISATVYAVVWIAACGYMMAKVVGPVMGIERSALLYATSASVLIAFTWILVRAALISREQYYCLGLALSTLLAGMLIPLVGQHYSYSLAHGFMAVGYLTVFAIQWVQLQKAAAHHAAD